MASGIRTFGIDVSHWNGKVSWDVVLKPDAPVTVHFAYVTEWIGSRCASERQRI
jgi:lysozyme